MTQTRCWSDFSDRNCRDRREARGSQSNSHVTWTTDVEGLANTVPGLYSTGGFGPMSLEPYSEGEELAEREESCSPPPKNPPEPAILA